MDLQKLQTLYSYPNSRSSRRFLVSKSQRKINSKTTRNMLTWSHYRFNKQLMHKVREYASGRVIISGEEYTSKTCSESGSLHPNFEGAKVIKCLQCNNNIKKKTDREFNAAKNILLKNINLVFTD